jgi:hypothetical protein
MPMPVADSPSGSIEPSALTKGLERGPGSGVDAAPGEAGAEGQTIGVTEADALMERYRSLGAAQQHRFGEGDLSTRPPDFNFGLPFSTTPLRTGAEGEAAAPAPMPTEPAATQPERTPTEGGPNQATASGGEQGNNGQRDNNREGGSNGSGRNP